MLTRSLDFPMVNACRPTKAGTADQYDSFVTKIAPDGGSLVYSTYIGGVRSDAAEAIAVDGAGSAYITGDTTSRGE